MIVTKSILIVDDEPRTRKGIKNTLENCSIEHPYHVETASNGIEAMEWLQHHVVHLLITDVQMPEFSGLDLIQSLYDKPNKPMIIVISGHAEFKYAQKALQLGAINYLLKPIDKEELLNVVQHALQMEEDIRRQENIAKLVDKKLWQLSDSNEQQSTPVREVVAYVEGHLHESITLSGLALMFHLNASYLSVLFKEQVGMTFSEYLSRSRIQRAKVLLAQTRMPIGEIAEKVGYQTDKYFIKVFKSLEFISPSKYRQQIVDKDEIE
ncbi:response regulator transcription factor [Paenibacillus crassostreae]|uniref:Two-component system response regulator n=1 Tax=Paenibacillus crassostreae TaxID=1763538 RepID=A0A167APM7_9BACL|nr:response regulator [Paenibacillus crassostreae]AOZ93750.1 DNA-binding response regulator [Paenibacillus crassostreae]OAB71285.1 two-component system response regulator [Paenibacillus crassostreae]